jgi:hypothetical protein
VRSTPSRQDKWSCTRQTFLPCWCVGECFIQHIDALVHECATIDLICHLAPQIEHQFQLFWVEEGWGGMPWFRYNRDRRWRKDLTTFHHRATQTLHSLACSSLTLCPVHHPYAPFLCAIPVRPSPSRGPRPLLWHWIIRSLLEVGHPERQGGGRNSSSMMQM